MRRPLPSICHTQPKTKVVGKLCKTLKNDSFFEIQLNLTLFIAPLSPKSNVEDVYTKYSVSFVFVLTATLKKGGRGGRDEKYK